MVDESPSGPNVGAGTYPTSILPTRVPRHTHKHSVRFPTDRPLNIVFQLSIVTLGHLTSIILNGHRRAQETNT